MMNDGPQGARGVPDHLAFFAGGGEMGALARAHDWTTSPLGPVEHWPQSLRTAASLMLNSRHPMFLAWGPRLAFLYNDGYVPIFGAKHPHTFGRPFAEVWAEIWDEIAPLTERALAGEATWFEDLHLVMLRNGYPEDTWYTFSYSPIRDETGGIGGMFCACTETTGRVLAERALRASETRWRGLFERMQEGFLVGEMIYDESGRAVDWRLIEVNGAWKHVTGLSSEGVVGRRITEVVPGIERHWIDAYVQVVETGKPIQFEQYVAPIDRWFEVSAYRTTEPRQFAVLFLNTTRRKRAEERQALMARGIDHRAKNALAVVQAMLRLTRADTVASFGAKLEGRIGALARTHSLLADTGWQGTGLRTLLERELEPFIGDRDDATARVRLDGPNLVLPSGVAQGIAMVVHELATNALKHGALSAETGVVAVAWRSDGAVPTPTLRLAWTERGGPPIAAPPTRQGFGSRVIEQTLRHQLGAEMTIDWRPGGLRFTMAARLRQTEQLLVPGDIEPAP